MAVEIFGGAEAMTNNHNQRIYLHPLLGPEIIAEGRTARREDRFASVSSEVTRNGKTYEIKVDVYANSILSLSQKKSEVNIQLIIESINYLDSCHPKAHFCISMAGSEHWSFLATFDPPIHNSPCPITVKVSIDGQHYVFRFIEKLPR